MQEADAIGGARTARPRARKRFSIRFPDKRADGYDQDQEWCEVYLDGGWRRFRFHDYDAIYEVPALYERIFYHKLKCVSPRRVVGLLKESLRDNRERVEELRALDVGAGNGMVGQELRTVGASVVVGTDIIPEAHMAADRDRPGVYDDYLVADLTSLSEDQRARFEDARFNAMTCVAALGFGDIPPLAFANAFNLVRDGGWIAFNVKDLFLSPEDETGFSRLIKSMMERGAMEMHAYRRYCHRLSIHGERLFYVAIVARKRRSVDADAAATFDD